MIKSNLCDYSDAYIHVKGAIAVLNTAAAGAAVNNTDKKKETIKSCTYILFKGTIAVLNTNAAGAAVNNADKKVIFKNCSPFTDSVTEINNTQEDDAQKIDVVMPMYNLIEQSDAYSNTSGRLQQYYKDEPALDNNDNIIDFAANNNNSNSFKFNQQITEQKGSHGTKDVEIMVPLK